MSKQKIQIAVAIDDEGEWSEWGFGKGARFHKDTEQSAARSAMGTLDSGGKTDVFIIEAALPLPVLEPKTVRCTVRKAK